MKKIFLLYAFATFSLIGCTQSNSKSNKTKPPVTSEKKTPAATGASYAGKHFEGAFSNGMKGAKISFDISADGKKLNNLTYKGYWYCGGKTEFANYAPDSGFDINNGKVNGYIEEKSSGVKFEWTIDATINSSSAEGTFNMRLNPGNCMTGTINWTATAK